jgi:hypothetical protein
MHFADVPTSAKVLFWMIGSGCIANCFGPWIVSDKWTKGPMLLPAAMWLLFFAYCEDMHFGYENLFSTPIPPRIDLAILYPLLGMTTIVSIVRWFRFRQQNLANP